MTSKMPPKMPSSFRIPRRRPPAPKKMTTKEICSAALRAVLLTTLVLVLPKVNRPANGAPPGTVVIRMVLTAQGKDRCPDPTNNDGPKVVLKARSRLDCARMCASREGCLSQSFNKNEKTCIHYYSTPAKMTPEKDCNFMVKPDKFEGCASEATKKMDPNGCTLPAIYKNKEHKQCIADTGKDTPQCVTANGELADCIVPVGFSAKQYVENFPVGVSTPLPCINNWILLMQRTQDSVNFTRNWIEYKNGFGDVAGSDFWLGNEKIHSMTSQPGMAYRLRIEMQAYSSRLWYYAEYETFSIDSEDKWYAIHLTGYSGDAGDSLTNTTVGPNYNHNGMNFTTYDADNDKSSEEPSCAVKSKGGWWFNDCYYACFTGEYGTRYAGWFTLEDYYQEFKGRLRTMRMMIRSI